MDIDITSPNYSNEPYETVVTLQGNYALPDDAYDLQVVDNIVYVANGNSGLQIIDVSDPTNPTFKRSYDTSGTAVDVWIENNYAYVADGDSGLQIIDLFAEIAPTNLSLSNNSIAENQAIATVIGNFSSVDPNTGDVFIYTLIHGEGSTDNALFAIQNGQLKSNTVFDYETKNNYSIRVRVTDQGGLFFEKSLTINITDVSESSIISLTVSPTSVTEDGTANLVYTFTRTGATTSALTVNYGITGTANSTDYTGATPGTGKTITFAPGSSTATLTIDPTADTTVEANETVALTLATGTGYTVGTTTAVTGTITNDDLPSITLAVSPSSVTEDGTSNLVYTFTRTGVTTNPLTVNYTLGGTATLNTDYTRTGTTNTVTFAAGSSTATVIVDPTADTTVESNETVALTLATGTGYTVGTPNTVTGTITNDDVTLPSITLSLNYSGISESSPSNFVYTFTRTGVTTNALTVNYNIAGTASATDYTGATPGNGKTITFNPGSTTTSITIDPTADTVVEPNETISLQLAAGTGYSIGTTAAQIATIINDDGTRRHVGTNGKDVLLGTNANDYLIGGAGDDILTGGTGGDIFYFASSNLGNDAITDFTPGQDFIQVSRQGFGGGLIAGDTITQVQFLIGSSATNASQRFIYNSTSGALLFDVDGNGIQSAQQIATLNTGLALTYEDIFVS